MRHVAPLIALFACTQDANFTPVKDVPEQDSASNGQSPNLIDTDDTLEGGDGGEDDGTSTTPPEQGLPPEIEVSPGEINFGTWAPHCSSDPRTITIRNVGGGLLEVQDITLEGFGVMDFQLWGGRQRLAGGESMTADVVFTPQRVANYNQLRVEVDSNDADEPVSRVDLFGESDFNGTRVDSFTGAPTDMIDVLFTLDFSSSMSEDLQDLAAAFPNFIQSFVGLGLNYRIGVITTDPNCAEFRGPVITPQTLNPQQAFIDQTSGGGCGGEAGFGATTNALSPPLSTTGANAGFLRPDANLAVIAISDEPEQTDGGGLCEPPFMSGCQPVNQFVNFLTGLKGGDASRVTFSAVVAPRQMGGLGQIASCRMVFGAPRYHDALQATGGVFGDLCQVDFGPFLSHLPSQVAGADYIYTLTRPPLSWWSGDIVVKVDGQLVPENQFNGFTYDPGTNSVSLHGSWQPGAGAAVTVEYPAELTCN